MKGLIFLLTWIVAASAVLRVSAADDRSAADRAVVTLEVTGRNPIDGPFLGFGAEWDVYAYNKAGFGPQDWALVESRIEWMRLPIVRSMMLARWCYVGEGRYDWNSPEMQMLYRQLDYCQKRGISVVLTEWGVNAPWEKVPEVESVADPKYAAIIAEYMHHLLEVRRYTCIKFLVFHNEPESLGRVTKNYDEARKLWIQSFKNVQAALAQRGLTGRVTLAGPDESGNTYDWLPEVIQELSGSLGAYDLHYYANQKKQSPTVRESARSGEIRRFFKEAWQFVRKSDPVSAKPLLICEAGYAGHAPEVPVEKQFGAAHNPFNEDWQYGVYMTQYAIQSVEAGSWATLAWMLDDTSHGGFNWGMWQSKANGFKLKPWFYTWALLSRSFPAGSQFSLVTSSDPAIETLAARVSSTGKEWAFCLVNSSDDEKMVALKKPDGVGVLSRYLYTQQQAKADANGMPVPVDLRFTSEGDSLRLTLPAQSVTFLVPGSL